MCATDSDKYQSQNVVFPLVKCKLFDDIDRTGSGSFWCWFDVNRSTFHEDICDNDFCIFVPMTF